MKDWIQKNINPPGINKKGRGSLFSVIGQVFEQVKNDALKAFNAHFPYLADTEKLEEHGKALGVPHLPHDREEEFRSRVAAAAFYHAGTGERSYIMQQLEEHFAGRYVISEEFLKVFIKIMDLEDEDLLWVSDFFDGILDPNVAFTAAEWFHIVEAVVIKEIQRTELARLETDVFQDGLCCDGRFSCDQGTDIFCDGLWSCDGSWPCDYFQPARGTISDTVLTPIELNGVYSCNGAMDCSGYGELYAPLPTGDDPLFDSPEDSFQSGITLAPTADTVMIEAVCDGTFVCDGHNLDSMLDAPMPLRIIRSFFCDGSKTLFTITCDGAIVCEGSYVCDEAGWYCSDVIDEEAL
jgi:hypothetical protein